jgi:hypothetical protein
MVTPSKAIKDTQDIRDKLLQVWALVDQKKISATEARLHISLARAVVETLKVECTFAHLAQTHVPAVPIIGMSPLRLTRDS